MGGMHSFAGKQRVRETGRGLVYSVHATLPKSLLDQRFLSNVDCGAVNWLWNFMEFAKLGTETSSEC